MAKFRIEIYVTSRVWKGGNVITLKDGAKIALSINASKKDLEKIADATRFMQERFLVDE